MAVESLQRTLHYASMARDAYRLKKTDNEQVAQLAKRHLCQRMGKMRGLPQKLGQMLSFSHTPAADESSANPFETLQEAAEPLPLDSILPQLQSAWGCPAEEALAEIEPHGCAASLGQVHRACLHDGREVAVKVQYPGIRGAVMHDLRMLGWLSIPVGNLRRGFDLSTYQSVVLDDLECELDYQHEAKLQAAFAAWSEASDWLAVPNPIDKWSTSTVLVSSWEEGEHWEDVQREWSPAQRRNLARVLLRFFCEGYFERGLLHADWHPGNLRFRRQGDEVSLLVYDFGCTFQPTLMQRVALLRLIRATATRSEPPLPLLLALGFNEEYLTPMVDKLPALCEVLCEPFTSEAPFDVAGWQLGERVGDILGEDRWNFRIAGPPQLIFLLRAIHGLKYYLQGLGEPVSWHRALRPYLRTMNTELDRLELPTPGCLGRGFDSLAKHLKIRVQEDGATKVQLTCLASAIEDLEDLLPADVKRRIGERQIDLGTIVSDVRRGGYAPGEVFSLIDRGKAIDVWLE